MKTEDYKELQALKPLSKKSTEASNDRFSVGTQESYFYRSSGPKLATPIEEFEKAVKVSPFFPLVKDRHKPFNSVQFFLNSEIFTHQQKEKVLGDMNKLFTQLEGLSQNQLQKLHKNIEDDVNKITKPQAPGMFSGLFTGKSKPIEDQIHDAIEKRLKQADPERTIN